MDALMLAGAALVALLMVFAVAQRRAARRAAEAEAEAEARALARRRSLPIVSSNLRGQLARPPGADRDLWAESAASRTGEGSPPGVVRPEA